jgi:hypothetical protein
MKKLVLIVILPLLLSSCYSYKTTTKDNITTSKHYKIKENQNTFVKISVDSIDNNTVYYKKNRKTKSLNITDKTIIKERKFSIIKTILIPVVTVSLGVIIINKAMDNMFKKIEIDFQPPP